MMHPSEVAAKVSQRVFLASESRHVNPPAPLLGEPSLARWQTSASEVDLGFLVASAEAMRAGEWVFLGTQDERPSDWLRDPRTGIECPREMSWRINFRSPSQVGSIKTVWEKNRHQHLQVIAAAQWLTGIPIYGDLVVQHLTSWDEHNPYLVGVNWASGIEVALRLVSWVWIERFLRGSAAHEVLFGGQGRLWVPVYRSLRLLQHTYSSGSSSNNHLIAELLGVFVASAAWPVWDESRRVADMTWERLQDEILRQTSASGFSREQAVGYHVFVTEMATTALLEARLSGRTPRSAFVRRLAEMVGAGEAFYSDKGARADFGDSDDSQVLGFLPAQSPRFDAVVTLAREIGATSRSPVRDTAGSLAAAKTALGILAPVEPTYAPSDISESGIHVLSAQTTSGEARVWFDVAELGMLPLAAHGHADALSIVVHLDGVPLVVDPGTFEFGLDSESREYFRGSRAHNVVVVDDTDQSEQSGAFMWKSVARVTLDSPPTCSAGAVHVSGSHDGYARHNGIGRVSRSVSLDSRELQIRDRVNGSGNHSVEVRFHLHPDAVVQLVDRTARIRIGGCETLLHLDERLTWREARGESMAGWFSDSFGAKVVTTTIVGRASVDLPWEGVCRLTFD